jgi:hypothetical protein
MRENWVSTAAVPNRGPQLEGLAPESSVFKSESALLKIGNFLFKKKLRFLVALERTMEEMKI